MAASATALSGGAICYSVSCPLATPSIWWAYSSVGLVRELPDSTTFLHSAGRSSFPGFIPLDYLVNSKSVMGMKPGDSSVVTGIGWMSWQRVFC